MSTIQGITDGYGSVLGSAERNSAEISKIDFMTLLVAQIQNQDPMSPMDNAEFTGQITQFTMLEELEGVNERLDENMLMSTSLNNTALLALVGKNATVEGDSVYVEDGQATRAALACDGPGVAEIKVLDEDGNVVRTIRRSVAQGLNEIEWDGLLDDDSVAADGNYTLDIEVTNNGIDVQSITLMVGEVQGLRYDNNVGIVTVNGEEFYVSEIYQIS